LSFEEIFIIKVIDIENKRMKHVIQNKKTGLEKDSIAPYPPNRDEYIWHPLQNEQLKGEPHAEQIRRPNKIPIQTQTSFFENLT